MKILYIGHYNEGSTSRMRGEQLRRILPATEFIAVNIDVPLRSTPKWIRSLGWRYKAGPLIRNIDTYLRAETKGIGDVDLVWIDKGVFIKPGFISELRQKTPLLVHYTPDPAFAYHRSKLFYSALAHYDYCVTTKSFELDDYQKFGVNTILATQGYDPMIHRPTHFFNEKRGVAFIGHREDDREEVIAKLLEAQLPVKVAGIYWQRFAFRYRHHPQFSYVGKGVFGPDYAKMISGAYFGLGFLSKIVPELHTTRTFEIPACGTALITEDNKEIRGFYDENEAVFFQHPNDIIEKIKFGLANKEWLRHLTENGRTKVTSLGMDYESILARVIRQIKPLSGKLKPLHVTTSV